MRYEVEIKKLVATLTNRNAGEIALHRWPTDYGLDSMSLLIFREECERLFGVIIPDDEWGNCITLNDILTFVGKLEDDTSTDIAKISDTFGQQYWKSSDMVEQLEIGMPLTGINKLSESALLKHLGDLRWRHIARLTGVSSKSLVDSTNERLYPAFFYVDVQFPEQHSMAAYGENDKVELIDTVVRFGSSLLDGIAYIVPDDLRNTLKAPLEGMSDALARGIPAVRLSNIFVMQFNGAEWLRKSRPKEHLISGIPATEIPPDSYQLNKQALEAGYLAQPGDTFVFFHKTVFEYKVNPDRDVNGVGLLYFANYPVFLDLAERFTLRSAPLSIGDIVINHRSVIRRRIAYLNNASWRDSIQVESSTWISNPFAGATGDPLSSSIRIFSNQIAYRQSDKRAMCVSSCEKVLYGITAADIAWIDQLCAPLNK